MTNIKRAKRASVDLRRGARAFEATGVTVLKAAEMARASGTVIAERNALGMRALTSPVEATAELSRLVPEKMQALAAVGTAVGEHTAEMGQRLMQIASDELTIAAQGVAQLSLCRTPEAYFTLQNHLIMDWFSRAFSHSMRIGTMITHSQAAALLPVHKAATGNARRLSGS